MTDDTTRDSSRTPMRTNSEQGFWRRRAPLLLGLVAPVSVFLIAQLFDPVAWVAAVLMFVWSMVCLWAAGVQIATWWLHD